MSAGLPIRLLRLSLPVRLGLGKRLRLTLGVRLALLRVKTLRRCGLRRLLGLLVRVVFGHGCAFPNIMYRTRGYTLLMVTKTLAVAAVTHRFDRITNHENAI